MNLFFFWGGGVFFEQNLQNEIDRIKFWLTRIFELMYAKFLVKIRV